MFEIILNWIKDNYPLIFVAIILIAITWFVAKKVFYVKRKINEHDKNIDKQNELIEKIENNFVELKEILIIIKTYLIEKDSKAARLFSAKASPRKLNEQGMEIYNEFNGDKFLTENQTLLFGKMQSKKPQTALDVEKDALEVLYECMESEIFDDIKLKVYNSKSIKIKQQDGTTIEYTITMNDICFVFSLKLRDMYLNEHSEIKTE